MSAYGGFFYFMARNHCVPFLFAATGGDCQMQLRLINNPDKSRAILYKIARVVYAETHATTLRLVEAMASMIANIANGTGRDYSDIISDSELFCSLNPESENNKLLSVNVTDNGFQMCLRVVSRMLHGTLPDSCNGATRFHHADKMPSWSTSRGYIADIDGLLFYL